MLVVRDGVVGQDDSLVVRSEEDGGEGAFGVVGDCVILDA